VKGRIEAALLVSIAAPLSAQDGARAVPRDTLSAYIVGSKETVRVALSYDRPVAIGRTILGDVVPYDRVWMTGSGAPPEFTCPSPFLIGTLKVPAGTYSLWTLPTRRGSTLIVNRHVGPGSTTYDSTADVGRVALAVDTLPVPTDRFSVVLRNDRKGPDTLTSRYDVRQSAAMHGEHYTLGLGPGTVQTLVITLDRFRWSVALTLQ
jgi:hypothetical protein